MRMTKFMEFYNLNPITYYSVDIPGDSNVFENSNESSGSNVPLGSNVPDNGIIPGIINPNRSYTWTELGTNLRLNNQDPNINRWVWATKQWLRDDLLPYINNFRISLFNTYKLLENSYTGTKYIIPPKDGVYKVRSVQQGFFYRAGDASFRDLITLPNNVISNPYMVHRSKEIEAFFFK